MNLKEIKLNLPQLTRVFNWARKSVDIWGRGSGKSFIIAWVIRQVVIMFPRGTFLIYGSTYVDILTNTLPTTLDALGQMGYIKDIHYTVGRRPAKKLKWDEPFRPVLDPERCIFFYNGTVFLLASQDRTKRGANVDGIICDEGLHIKKDKFEKDVIPTNRGNGNRFGHISTHHFVHIFSSMPYKVESNWLLDAADEYAAHFGIDYRGTKTALIKKQLAFIDSSDINEKRELWAEITRLKQKIRYTRYVQPNGQTAFYQEADCLDNIQHLGWDSILTQRSIMTDASFRIEMLNERMNRIDGGFYPNLDIEQHTYDDALRYDYIDSMGFDFKKLEHRDSRWDADCNPKVKLEISVDWGARINAMTIHQCHGLEDRAINNLFVVSPKILDDVVNDFCDYYKHHECKEVDFYYDRNGNSRVANSKLTYAQQATSIMRKRGWHVNQISKGLDAKHNAKYYLINKLLSGNAPAHSPSLSFNYTNAKHSITSMLGAPAKEVNGEIKKDKTSERKSSVNPEDATDFSDAEDVYFYTKYAHLLNKRSRRIGIITS